MYNSFKKHENSKRAQGLLYKEYKRSESTILKLVYTLGAMVHKGYKVFMQRFVLSRNEPLKETKIEHSNPQFLQNTYGYNFSCPEFLYVLPYNMSSFVKQEIILSFLLCSKQNEPL